MIEQQIAARAAEEHLDKSGWIARACALVLEGGGGDAVLRDQLGYLAGKLADSERQLEDYRAVVEEVRLLRSRQEDIARAQGAAFERVFDGISLLREAAPALPVSPGSIEEAFLLSGSNPLYSAWAEERRDRGLPDGYDVWSAYYREWGSVPLLPSELEKMAAPPAAPTGAERPFLRFLRGLLG